MRSLGVGRVAALLLVPQACAQDCTFQNEIDPYTQYNDLNGDSTAQSSDQCKSNCCADANCQVWQWSDDPMTPPNCWSGDSSDYGDSGGVEWQGEQGKGGPTPAPGPGPGPGPAPTPPAPGGANCIGVHCTQDEAESNWGSLFCFSLAGLCGLYVSVGIYSNMGSGKTGAEVIPNFRSWTNLAGLVKDGVMVSMGKGVEKYEPVPRMDQNLQAQGGAAQNVIYGGDLEAGGRGSMQQASRSRSSSSGRDSVVVVGPDGKKQKRKKKTEGQKGAEKIVVVDPVTGKKKVKRKVKKGEKSAQKTRKGGGEGVKVKKSTKVKSKAGAASLE